MSYYFSLDIRQQLESPLHMNNVYYELLTGVDLSTGNKLVIKVYENKAANMTATLMTPQDKPIYSYEGVNAEELLTYMKDNGLLAGHGNELIDYLKALDYNLETVTTP